MCHPERSTRYSAPLPCSGREAKDLRCCSSGQPILQAALDSPMVLRSRSFGFAETALKCVAVSVARLRMARRRREWIQQLRKLYGNKERRAVAWKGANLSFDSVRESGWRTILASCDACLRAWVCLPARRTGLSSACGQCGQRSRALCRRWSRSSLTEHR